MSLDILEQSDFASGMFRSTAPHAIPENGCFDALNSVLTDDGSVKSRGGSTYLSPTAFGTSLSWIWDGHLAAGPRTVIANSSNFGVLDATETPVTLAGLSVAGLTGPTRAVEVGGLLFVGGGTVYAGSRKPSDYTTGTVSLTLSSKTVTGAGTTWAGTIDAGGLFALTSGRYYAIASVDSDTQITLADPYEGATASGQTYAVRVIRPANAPYKLAEHYAVVGDRLLAASGRRVDFSEGRSTTGVMRPHSFPVNNFHLLPDGVEITGIEGVGDTALIFTTGGLWTISNMAQDLVDDFGNPQQTMAQVSRDLILWSHAGIASWSNGLLVPAVDGVWLVGTNGVRSLDSVSAPTRLTNSITNLYTDYVRLGYKTGRGVVHRNHYYLPILDAGSTPKDLLVCRLDRPVRTRVGLVFPWTHFNGTGGSLTALATRVGSVSRSPVLIGAAHGSGRVVTLPYFDLSATNRKDHDGSTFRWELTTRDYATGRRPVENYVRRLRARYELKEGGTDLPKIRAAVGTGERQVAQAEWGLFDWGQASWGSSDSEEYVGLTGEAPTDKGLNPYTWSVDQRSRFIRFRLQSSAPTASLVLRSLELSVRQSNKA